VKLHFRGRRPPLSLPALLRLTPADLLAHLRGLDLDRRGRLIVADIVPQIEERLKFLAHVGLGYLSLDRPTETLSGGEAQRIRLAAQLGSNLSGCPLRARRAEHRPARPRQRPPHCTLEALRAKGNTLLVVEHDEELMARADHIIDLGPAAGIHGGELLAAGTPAEIKASALPHRALPRQGHRASVARRLPPAPAPPFARLLACPRRRAFRNLKGFDLRLPLGRLIVVAGPSGAGKSTLFRDVLHPAVGHAPSNAARASPAATSSAPRVSATIPPACGRPPHQPPSPRCAGPHGFRRVIEVDQAPIGKTPRSTPATYLGIFDQIRQFFAACPSPRSADTPRRASPSTPPAAAARRARAPGASSSRWRSCRTPTFPATPAAGRATAPNWPT
jgi:excinuclease ABC subunit A